MKKRNKRYTDIPGWKINKPSKRRKTGKTIPFAGFGRYLIGVIFIGVVINFLGMPVVERVTSHPVFSVRNVVVEKAAYLDEDEIIKTAFIQPGENIFKVDLEQISKTLKETFTTEEFTVFRRLPDTITIRVLERKPVALMNTETLIGVDTEGIPLIHVGAASVETLPIITGIESVSSLSNPEVKERLITGLRLLERISEDAPSVYQRISEVDVSSVAEMGIMLIDNGLEIIIGEDDWSRKIPDLKRIISGITDQIESIKAVDIRYDEKIFVRKEENQRGEK